ncbi:MAG: hypothetical protein ABFD00_07170 [Chloroherpetonaceae bacterium]
MARCDEKESGCQSSTIGRRLVLELWRSSTIRHTNKANSGQDTLVGK